MDNGKKRQMPGAGPGGTYDSGLEALLKSLKICFAVMAAVIVALLVYFFTIRGFFRVDSRQAVVVLRFGRYVTTCTHGWYWFMPYPVTKTVAIPTSPQHFSYDFAPAKTAAADESGAVHLEPGRDNYVITGDANILHTSWSITYQIYDPEKYFKTIYSAGDYTQLDEKSGTAAVWRGPTDFLGTRFAQTVIEISGSRSVNDILFGAEKSEYLSKVENSFAENIRLADCGIIIRNVNLAGAVPPQQTREAFGEVAAAVNKKTTMILEAQEYAVKTENSARAKASEIAAAAEIYKQKVVSELKSQNIYFKSINKEYRKSPAMLTALYYAALTGALGGAQDAFVLDSPKSGAVRQLRMKLNPQPKTGNSGSETAEEGADK